MLNKILETLGLGRGRPEVYPFGTYGYGPDPRKEGDSDSGVTAVESPTPGIASRMTAAAPVIDADRPDTTLERAQAGEPSSHTGPEARRSGDNADRKVVAFESRSRRARSEESHWAFMFAVAAATVASATVMALTYRHRRLRTR